MLFKQNQKKGVEKMTDIDRNFNNTIDEYYSSDIGSEFEDDLTQSEIDEVMILLDELIPKRRLGGLTQSEIDEIIEQEIKQQQNNNEVKK